MRIVTLTAADRELIGQAAAVLVAAFAHMPDTWDTLDEGLEEVRELLGPDQLVRAALDDDGRLLGWIGGIEEYDGHTWELHPLAVHPDYQRQGIGRALVADLEAQLRARDVTTIILGSDDVLGQTSVSGVDLYPNLPGYLANVQDRGGHPFVFYQKCGYTIYGMVPDANGPGKPDILMAKRLKEWPEREQAALTGAQVTVRTLTTPAAARAVRAPLAALLRAVVEGGASVGFLPPLEEAAALAYWDAIGAQLADGGRRLLVAETPAGGLVGTAQLLPAASPNGHHRAEVAKVMVHPDLRRQGIGRTLMEAVEAAAGAAGWSLLVLDTRAGEPSERLYRRLGWSTAGIIPDYAYSADGTRHATVYMYKWVGGTSEVLLA